MPEETETEHTAPVEDDEPEASPRAASDDADPGAARADVSDDEAQASDDDEPEADLLEGFDEGVREADDDIDRALGDKLPGTRNKDERWYEVVERQIQALPRAAGKDRRTMDEVFDKRTMMTLYKYLSNGVIQSLDFPVSTGKEANVFHATTPEATSVCVKIFRTNNATFHDVLQYIQGDPRFVGIKKEKRGLVKAWAQKEYRNLGRAIDNGVSVPAPMSCLDNVLLMEYVGDETSPAPRLKDATIDEPEIVALAILDDYHRLLVKARLVHADLSEFNILYHDGGPVIIDVGQAVLLEHPMAREFFDRDVRNMARFLTRLGYPIDEAAVRRHVLGPDHEHFEDLL